MRTISRVLDDRYLLDAELGQGGSASVHRAFDQHHQRWVAVKILSPQMAQHLSARRRFAREVAVLRSLDHPNLVKLYGWSSQGEQTWLAMELVEGRSLEYWSRQYGGMAPRMAVEVALEICAGVQAAHHVGIIHRDIKPANVLVSPEGQCKVVDFGLAAGEGHERLTRTGVTMGTYGFMAPEQHDDAAKVNESADVFSLGATLVALLNGRAHLDIRSGLDAISAQTPLSLARALVRATLTDPSQRYPTLAHFGQSLQRTLKHLPATHPNAPDLHIPLSFDDQPPGFHERPTLIRHNEHDTGETIYLHSFEEEPPTP
ncbi:MAG: serine/threonine-protein kinase [Myxococcota bacterium]